MPRRARHPLASESEVRAHVQERWNDGQHDAQIGEAAREHWDEEPRELGLLLLDGMTDELLGRLLREARDRQPDFAWLLDELFSKLVDEDAYRDPPEA